MRQAHPQRRPWFRVTESPPDRWQDDVVATAFAIALIVIVALVAGLGA